MPLESNVTPHGTTVNEKMNFLTSLFSMMKNEKIKLVDIKNSVSMATMSFPWPSTKMFFYYLLLLDALKTPFDCLKDSKLVVFKNSFSMAAMSLPWPFTEMFFCYLLLLDALRTPFDRLKDSFWSILYLLSFVRLRYSLLTALGTTLRHDLKKYSLLNYLTICQILLFSKKKTLFG